MAGTVKENPRYNVVATRLSDDDREDLDECLHFTKLNQTEYIRQAITEKNERERSQASAMPEVQRPDGA